MMLASAAFADCGDFNGAKPPGVALEMASAERHRVEIK
jgi:hypothetical protein